jgi:hypothetical protein
MVLDSLRYDQILFYRFNQPLTIFSRFEMRSEHWFRLLDVQIREQVKYGYVVGPGKNTFVSPNLRSFALIRIIVKRIDK